MTTAVNLVAAALQLATIYGIVNFGLVNLYRTTGVVNFAQGPMLMVGAWCVSVVAVHFGGLAIGIVAVLIGAAIIGVLLYASFLRLLSPLTDLSKVVAAFMVGTVLTQIAGLIWGTDSDQLQFPNLGTVTIDGGRIPVLTLVSAGLLIVLVGVAEYVTMRTRWGLQARAARLNSALAVYFGVRQKRLDAIAWAIACSCAVLGGVVYAQRVQINAQMALVGLAAFPAAVIGGLDSVIGMFVGGALVASVQAVSSYYLPAELSDALCFALVIGALLIRPYGLFGRPQTSRL